MGRDWFSTGSFESGYIAPDPADPNNVYSVGWYGSVLRLDRRTGQLSTVFVPGPKYRYAWETPLAFSPTDKKTLYVGMQQVLATANGTSALYISLKMFGVEPGDEVIVPPYTFIATINAVLAREAMHAPFVCERVDGGSRWLWEDEVFLEEIPLALDEDRQPVRRREEYRASASIDIEHDRADASQKIACPLRVLWGERGVVHRIFTPISDWQEKCALPVTGRPLPCGHYIAEELPDVLGAEFRGNAVELRGGRDGLLIEGFAALPTLTRANALGQYLFVNGRPVRDKLILGAVRGAYADYLPRDRHPIVALFVTLDPHEVDVNVHPAKAEVRFRDPALVRALLITSLQQALVREGQRASPTGGSATIAAFRPAAGVQRARPGSPAARRPCP